MNEKLSLVDWLQIEMAARGCIDGTSDDWPLLRAAISKVTGKPFRYRQPASWLQGFCEGVLAAQENPNVINSDRPVEEAVKCNASLHNEANDDESAERSKRLAKRSVLTECASQRDGDCHHIDCPQLKDRKSHCPLDKFPYPEE